MKKYKEERFYPACPPSFEGWYESRSQNCTHEPASVKFAMEAAYNQGVADGRKHERSNLFWEGLPEKDQRQIYDDRVYGHNYPSIEVEVKSVATFPKKPEVKKK